MSANKWSSRVILAVIGLCFGFEAVAQTRWEKELEEAVPLFGHRNWIVVADSAYPAQISSGVKTIATGVKQIEVVEAVLGAVEKAPHVRGTVFLDTELPHVPEQHAPGIAEYRSNLKQVLEKRKTISLPHEEIIAQLDEAGKTFHVLVLKTDLTLPYTSVFVRLDCGYWSDEAEAALRKAMANQKKAK